MTRQRRRLFPIIYKSIQYRFLAMVVLYSFSLIFCIGLFIFAPDILEMKRAASSPEIRLAAAERILVLHARLWPVLFALVCLITLHSFYALHRIVGPIYRLRVSLDRIRDGDLAFDLRFRKGDYLGLEEKSFNQMLRGLDENWRRIRELQVRALTSLETLEAHLREASPDSAGLMELCRLHRRELEALQKTAGYYRLDEDRN